MTFIQKAKKSVVPRALITAGIACLVAIPNFTFAQVGVNYADKVNTQIGNLGKGHGVHERYLEAGYTFPGALYPMGLVQFTPTFFEADRGFVVNQLSGAGCDHMGNFPTLPLKGELTQSPDGMTGFKPNYKVQKAVAGYYNTTLFDDIQARLTVTKRTGMAEYTYPAGEKRATIVIGSGTNGTVLSEANINITGAGACEGYADGGYFCGKEQPVNYRVYFVAKFDVTPVASGTWSGKNIQAGSKSAVGANTGAYFTFNVAENKIIRYKFAISYVSLANARLNLAAENKGWDFNTVKAQTQSAWNKYLGKIEVSGGSADLTTQFYSHLYHALAHPNISNDINGEYIGADYKVHKAVGFDNYTSFSNWDTYRTQIQLMALLAPKEASDVITSTVNFANMSGGGLPRWVMASTETGIMQGDPTSIVIANAYAFGAKSFDTKAALQVMRRGAEIPGTKSQDRLTRPQLEEYWKGYADASRSLEYTSADFAIGQFALQSQKQTATYQKYLERSRLWKKLYDPGTKWLRGRTADGGWKGQNDDMREASYKSYFWMVPYNIKGLVDTIGGPEAADKRLDEYFEKLNANYHEEWFAAGNEPDFQVPWTYNWIGKPYKTQALIRRIVKEQYSNRPMGLPGNDDLGAMGAWYVFANVGMFPMIPGVGGFSVNSPAFPLIKVHLKNGKVLTIKGGSEHKPYVTSLKINGKTWNNPWIPLKQLENGGTVDFSLSDYPDKNWGTGIEQPSYR
ncbi:glycoside hydrolase family 92 protein [Mucilaginibacter hurinus]|uniref:Glycoside hydrolase family 92 protein n=1 Tax=Mucilaginibacter hurinus TaxID=2201324 RepID=A0A367GR39_9SPHI|nr:GH92 family glycosyl hydrolase [Mucilaginibacter hurinus]RCH55183.1 glycoside hydrolase family 92 protein [Mucilaginibacter hurinus]